MEGVPDVELKADGCACATVLRAPTGTHSQTADYPDPGDVLELTDMNSLSCIDTFRVVSCTRTDDPWRSELVLDKPLPAEHENLTLVNATQMPRLEYIGNYCRSHLGRSVLVKIKDALIEGNTIIGNPTIRQHGGKRPDAAAAREALIRSRNTFRP